MQSSKTILLTVIALLVAICRASIVVHTRNNTDVPFDSMQLFYRGSPSEKLRESLTAPIVSIKEDADFAGKIVVVPSFLLKSNLPQIRAAQSRGAVGVLATLDFLYVPGYGQYMVDLNDVRELTIPVVEIALLESRALKKLNQSSAIANITLLPNDHQNRWQAAYESGWIFVWQSKSLSFFGKLSLLNSSINISMGLSSVAVIVLASIKIAEFMKFYGKFQISIAIVVLSIDIFGAFLRLLYSIDPFQVHGLYSDETNIGLLANSIPLVHIAAILIVFYWYEMMHNTSLKVTTFISRMKIPFFVLVGLIVAVHVVRLTLAQVLGLGIVNLVNSIWALFVSTAVVVLYSVVGGQLLVRLRRLKQGKNVRRLTKITIRILASGFVLLGIAVTLSLFVSVVPTINPTSWIVCWYINGILCAVFSLLSISAFKVPTTKKSSKPGQSNPAPSLTIVTTTN